MTFLAPDIFRTIVRHAPLPGGRIAKDEKLAEAFARLNLYADNALDEPGYGTHYVVLAYALAVASEVRLPTTQHTAYRWLGDTEALADPAVHENTKVYCR